MSCNRKERIAGSFGQNCHHYDAQANIQKQVAEELAGLLPSKQEPRILEIGCGTGFLTEHLLYLYPDGMFDITDLSPAMLKHCQSKFPVRDNTNFRIMDGEAANPDERYDLIVSSMSVQWFDDPMRGLERLQTLLKPGGILYYAVPGPESFKEWKDSLQAAQAPSGFADIPALPGIVKEMKIRSRYTSAQGFLKSIKNIGAHQPKENYTPLHPALLRQVCRYFDETYKGAVTWQILMGALESPKRS